MKLIPYFPLTKPISGVEAARRFDADAFDAHPSLVAYVRLVVEREFAGAPDALRVALEQPPMPPFRYVVKVDRAVDGDLFPHHREILQVRAVDGFDPQQDGILRDGFLSNAAESPAQPPKSLGELSHLLYAPPTP